MSKQKESQLSARESVSERPVVEAKCGPCSVGKRGAGNSTGHQGAATAKPKQVRAFRLQGSFLFSTFGGF